MAMLFSVANQPPIKKVIKSILLIIVDLLDSLDIQNRDSIRKVEGSWNRAALVAPGF